MVALVVTLILLGACEVDVLPARVHEVLRSLGYRRLSTQGRHKTHEEDSRCPDQHPPCQHHVQAVKATEVSRRPSIGVPRSSIDGVGVP